MTSSAAVWMLATALALASGGLRITAYSRGRKIPWTQPVWRRVDDFQDERLNRFQNRLNLVSYFAIPLMFLAIIMLIDGGSMTEWVIAGIIVTPVVARTLFYEACWTFAELSEPTEHPAL